MKAIALLQVTSTALSAAQRAAEEHSAALDKAFDVAWCTGLPQGLLQDKAAAVQAAVAQAQESARWQLGVVGARARGASVAEAATLARVGSLVEAEEAEALRTALQAAEREKASLKIALSEAQQKLELTTLERDPEGPADSESGSSGGGGRVGPRRGRPQTIVERVMHMQSMALYRSQGNAPMSDGIPWTDHMPA